MFFFISNIVLGICFIIFIREKKKIIYRESNFILFLFKVYRIVYVFIECLNNKLN